MVSLGQKSRVLLLTIRDEWGNIHELYDMIESIGRTKQRC